jgi:hypothetical protein
LRPVINAGVESARTRKSLGIAAGTLKNGPDVYCIDDSEIMRELQCMSQLRSECWSVSGVWAYTGLRTWEGDVAVEAASVGRLVDS